MKLFLHCRDGVMVYSRDQATLIDIRTGRSLPTGGGGGGAGNKEDRQVHLARAPGGG